MAWTEACNCHSSCSCCCWCVDEALHTDALYIPTSPEGEAHPIYRLIEQIREHWGKHPDDHPGAIALTYLHQADPDLANQILGSDLDPQRDPERLPDFYKAVLKLWTDNPPALTLIEDAQ